MHRPLGTVLVALLVLLCGCGSSPHAAPTPTAMPTPTPTPLPSPTPGPDTERVDVLATGVGVYLLTTIPVAVVRNDATQHAATNVTVRFAVFDSAGKPIGGTDAQIPYIAPGQTMGIGGRLDQSGSNLHATAMVLGTPTWNVAGPTPPLTFGPATYTCGNCASGPGYGTASGTLSAARGVTVSNVTVTAICYQGAAITGGDSDLVAVSTLPKAVQEPVIVTAAPTRCDMYASPGP